MTDVLIGIHVHKHYTRKWKKKLFKRCYTFLPYDWFKEEMIFLTEKEFERHRKVLRELYRIRYVFRIRIKS